MNAAAAKTEATALFRRFLITLVRIAVGARSEWLGCTPKPVRRIYFANHGSHVDTIAVMAALPWQVRRRTHPVAARDYWGKTRLHRFIAETVVCAVLIDRNPKPGSNPLEPVERLLERGQSILIFPEGTRAEGDGEVAEFRSGIFRLAKHFPGIELVPVYLDNLRRILPKGSILPVPITCTARFGAPLRLEAGEEKAAFLQRARAAVLALDVVRPRLGTARQLRRKPRGAPVKETVFGVLAGIVALLTVASLVGYELERRATKPKSIATVRNLNARTRSWWVMVLVVGGAILLGHTTTVVLFAILSFMALREFWTLTPSRRGDHYALFLSFFVVLPYHYYLLGTEWYGMFIIFIPVYAFLLLPAVATLMGDTNEFLARSAKVQWGLMLTVFAISHAPALLMLDTAVPSALLIVYLIIVVQLSDVFQYVWGKLIGKHRFSPNISPSKTIEGLVGGGLSAILVGTLLHRMTPFSPLQAAAVSTVIVVAGFFGGFVLSAIKRDLKAKDWGYIIEGHGGVLDRVDSLTFAAPLFFHVTRYWFTV